MCFVELCKIYWRFFLIFLKNVGVDYDFPGDIVLNFSVMSLEFGSINSRIFLC